MRRLIGLAFLWLVLASPSAFASMAACSAAMSKSDPSEQVFLYTKCIESGLDKKNRAGAYGNRGVAYMQLGEYDKALEDLNRSIELDPKWGLSYLNRGSIYAMRGQFDEAEADFDMAVKLPPSRVRADAYFLRAQVRVVKGNCVGAVTDFEGAIKFNRKMSDAHAGKAWVLATCPDTNVRDGAKAIEAAQKAIGIEDKPAYHDALAAAYAEAGQFESAVSEVTFAIENADGYDVRPLMARRELYRQNIPYRSGPEPDLQTWDMDLLGDTTTAFGEDY